MLTFAATRGETLRLHVSMVDGEPMELSAEGSDMPELTEALLARRGVFEKLAGRALEAKLHSAHRTEPLELSLNAPGTRVSVHDPASGVTRVFEGDDAARLLEQVQDYLAAGMVRQEQPVDEHDPPALAEPGYVASPALAGQDWDGRLDLQPLPRRRMSMDDRLALRLFPSQRGRDGLTEDDGDGTPELRSMEVGGFHFDMDLVNQVIRNGLRMQHDMGPDTMLEFGLIQPKTARSTAGRNVTTVGMRLQLSPAWEVHAGYGAAFGSGMRAQVGLSLNW